MTTSALVALACNVELMAIKLNRRAWQHARYLIANRKAVLDQREAWSRHRPSSRQQDAYIEAHGIRSYGTWFLGIDDQAAEGTKMRHKFPYGDLKKVHRCAVLSTERRAAQYKYVDVEEAAAQLHSMLEVTHDRSSKPGHSTASAAG
jgi:hypothetical protein